MRSVVCVSTSGQKTELHVRLTRVDARNSFDRVEQKHDENTDAENLDAVSAHVEHKRVHRKGFCWRDGHVPCTLFFEGLIGLLFGL